MAPTENPFGPLSCALPTDVVRALQVDRATLAMAVYLARDALLDDQARDAQRGALLVDPSCRAYRARHSL